jgi:hypothetical protein
MWCGSTYDEQQETIMLYGQWILLVFIPLHPLHTSVGGTFQTAQLQSDSKVSGGACIPGGYFQHCPFGFVVSLS